MLASFVTGSGAQTSTTAASDSIAWPVAVSKGDLLFVATNMGSAQTITSVADTQGNTYIQVQSRTVNSGANAQSCYFAIAKGASAVSGNSVTITYSASTTLDIRIGSFTGVDQTNPVHVSPVATAQNSVVPTGNIVTLSGNTMIVMASSVSGSVTGVGGGATNIITSSVGNNLEFLFAAAPGVYAPTATPSETNAVVHVIAFNSPGSGLLRAKPQPRGF